MRRLILVLVLAPVLCAFGGGIWLLLEHGTGKRAWLAWKAQRTALGDRFDWKDLAPPGIPDGENFAMAPLIVGAVCGKDIAPRFKALEPPKLDKEWGDWKEGRRIDLEACAAAYKTKNLTETLAPHEGTLRELDEASRRPHSRLPVDYTRYEAPGLLGFRNAMRTLRLRALVQLARGNSEAAFADVLTGMRIADHLKQEPNLIASLLRNAILTLDMQPVWEGLLDHRWHSAQLEILQKELLGTDVLASLRLGFEGERMTAIAMFSCLAEGTPLPEGLKDVNPMPPVRLGWLGKGWFYRNLLELDRYYATSMLDTIHPAHHRVYPEKQTDPHRWLKARQFRKDLVMAQIALPALMGQLDRTARLQSGIDQAAVVCALERHRLAKGAYPATLAELSPSFMARVPRDVVNGKELRYERRGESFRLYSVGWDLVDDGGRMVPNSDPQLTSNVKKGDWPWVPEIR